MLGTGGGVCPLVSKPVGHPLVEFMFLQCRQYYIELIMGQWYIVSGSSGELNYRKTTIYRLFSVFDYFLGEEAYEASGIFPGY